MFEKVVLIIDKRPELTVKYKRILESDEITVLTSNDFSSGFKLLNEFEPDLVLISDSMDSDIKKAIEQIRILTYNSRPEIIALSKSNHIKDKIDTLDAGADDFISEPVNSEEFKARVTAHLRRNFETCFSEKTMLCNSKISYKMIKRTLHSHTGRAIMLADIDNFASYREIYGELAGEKLLQTYAAIIKSAIGEKDYAGHIADDDFVIITDHEKAEKIANYLIYAFDTVVAKFYSQNDARRGYMFMHGDDVAEDKIKLVSTSIGIISGKYKKYNDLKQVLGSVITVHKLAKHKKGSSYVMERPEITADNAVAEIEKNMNVLIAEPDESLSLLLEAAAKIQGYNVIVVENSDEIIPAVKTFNPSVVILDAGNTETFKGLEVCKKLKSEISEMHFSVILTTTIHDKEPVLDAGADLYLPKPYELSVMFKWIKKFNDDFNNN